MKLAPFQLGVDGIEHGSDFLAAEWITPLLHSYENFIKCLYIVSEKLTQYSWLLKVRVVMNY